MIEGVTWTHVSVGDDYRNNFRSRLCLRLSTIELVN